MKIRVCPLELLCRAALVAHSGKVCHLVARKPTLRKLYEPGNTPTEKVGKAAKASKKKTSKKKRKNGPANGGTQPRKKAKRANNFTPKEDELIVKAYSATSQNGVKGSDQKVDDFKHDVWEHLGNLWVASKMDPKLGSLESRGHDPDKVFSWYKALQHETQAYEAIHHSLKKKKPSGWNELLFQDAACDLYKQQRGSSFKSF
jgi:hypothetical protein